MWGFLAKCALAGSLTGAVAAFIKIFIIDRRK
jgi:hypothetical protein